MTKRTALSQILNELHATGCELARCRDTVILYGPLRNVPRPLRAALLSREGELLAYLHGFPCRSCGLGSFPLPDVECVRCANRCVPHAE